MDDVFAIRMSGGPLTEHQKAALGPWLDRMPAPAPSWVVDTAAIERGRRCSTARRRAAGQLPQRRPLMTNNQPRRCRHRRQVQGADAPIGVGARAPFMHNGCAQTLTDRFGVCGGGTRTAARRTWRRARSRIWSRTSSRSDPRAAWREWRSPRGRLPRPRAETLGCVPRRRRRMKIYGHPMSTCTRKVLMTLVETNTPVRARLVRLRQGRAQAAAAPGAPAVRQGAVARRRRLHHVRVARDVPLHQREVRRQAGPGGRPRPRRDGAVDQHRELVLHGPDDEVRVQARLPAPAGAGRARGRASRSSRWRCR